MMRYAVIDEEGRILRRFEKHSLALRFARSFNRDRHPHAMEYLVIRDVWPKASKEPKRPPGKTWRPKPR